MTNELASSLQTIKQWLSNIDPHNVSINKITSDEKKQLLAVNRSIQLLQRQGVAVPEELRAYKLKLSAIESVNVQNDDNAELLEELIESLGALKKQAQTTLSQIKITKSPSGPKRHYKVDLEDLLEFGYLSLESRLVLQWQKNGTQYEGKLHKKGMVCVSTHSGEKMFKSLSSAATEIAGCSLNGWKHWYVVSPDGKRTTLEEIRQKYMAE